MEKSGKADKTDRFLRLPAVIRITGRSPSAIRRDVAAGRFPAPRKIGPRAVAWLLSEIEEWRDSCKPSGERDVQ